MDHRRFCRKSGAYGLEGSVAKVSICIFSMTRLLTILDCSRLIVDEERAEIGKSSDPRLHVWVLWRSQNQVHALSRVTLG